MNKDTLSITLEYASLAEQIHLYRMKKDIRPYFNDVMKWNLSEDFFYDAIKNNNIKDISFIIHKIPIAGASMIKQQEDAESLLDFVIQKGSLDDIKTILKYNQNIDTDTVILNAIDRRDLVIIKLVVNSTKKYHLEDLIPYAVNKGVNPSVIKILKNAGADINDIDQYNMTAFSYAIKNDDEESAMELLENDLDIHHYYHHEDIYPQYLMHALYRGNKEIIKMILDRRNDIDDVINNITMLRSGLDEFTALLSSADFSLDELERILSYHYKYGDDDISLEKRDITRKFIKNKKNDNKVINSYKTPLSSPRKDHKINYNLSPQHSPRKHYDWDDVI